MTKQKGVAAGPVTNPPIQSAIRPLGRASSSAESPWFEPLANRHQLVARGHCNNTQLPHPRQDDAAARRLFQGKGRRDSCSPSRCSPRGRIAEDLDGLSSTVVVDASRGRSMCFLCKGPHSPLPATAYRRDTTPQPAQRIASRQPRGRGRRRVANDWTPASARSGC